MKESPLSAFTKALEDINRAYFEFYRHTNMSLASPKEDPDFWYEIQDKLRLSFFLLAFAQFDGFITEFISEIEDSDDPPMRFMIKVGCFIDTKSEEFREIRDLYDLRCDIAHGRSREMKERDILDICEQLKLIAQKIASPPDYLF